MDIVPINYQKAGVSGVLAPEDEEVVLEPTLVNLVGFKMAYVKTSLKPVGSTIGLEVAMLPGVFNRPGVYGMDFPDDNIYQIKFWSNNRIFSKELIMKSNYIFLVLFWILVIMSCSKYEDSQLIPKPEISFYEGRDYWNNPIYIVNDTNVTGTRSRGIYAHFAAAGSIKKVTAEN
jgi:hypothetical protein